MQEELERKSISFTIQRIYAHFFLGMSYSAIARTEGCDESSVRRSVYRGLKQLQKYFLKNSF